ncbi:MAG: hypothetical protein QOC66_3808 [Pseudonocardiales bacterium]|nr:hypothetical protein [Pseudonocardiales bacterium]
MTPTRADRGQVISAAQELAERMGDRTCFLGVDGFGAAGKSSLAEAIAEAVPRATVIHIDDFWGPSIAEWDWNRFRAQVLVALLAGRPARYQVWDWIRDAGGEWRDVPTGRLVVVEGVSCTRAEAGVPWDLTVWVEAPRPVRLARALERDGDGMLHRWLDDWIPSEEAYAARERPQERLDFIVSGTA